MNYLWRKKHSMLDQITSHILMVRPNHFGYNEETAVNNAFQTSDAGKDSDAIKRQAREEFDVFIDTLRGAGVDVMVFEDTEHPQKPDAVFPNNWVSFHNNGAVITYPVYAPVRRLERREDIVQQVMDQFGHHWRIHLEHYEEQELYLEGTGSLILDRPNQTAYACLSPRTELRLVQDFCQQIEYSYIVFNSTDADGQPIYHTNVMMAIGETFVVICLASITDAAEREALLAKFAETEKEVIDITMDQVSAFAGNMLQVKSTDGTSYLVMSEQAYQSLRPAQVEVIERHTRILHSPLYTIEKYGGGSARCMMAEVFVPDGV